MFLKNVKNQDTLVPDIAKKLRVRQSDSKRVTYQYTYKDNAATDGEEPKKSIVIKKTVE